MLSASALRGLNSTGPSSSSQRPVLWSTPDQPPEWHCSGGFFCYLIAAAHFIVPASSGVFHHGGGHERGDRPFFGAPSPFDRAAVCARKTGPSLSGPGSVPRGRC